VRVASALSTAHSNKPLFGFLRGSYSRCFLKKAITRSKSATIWGSFVPAASKPVSSAFNEDEFAFDPVLLQHIVHLP